MTTKNKVKLDFISWQEFERILVKLIKDIKTSGTCYDTVLAISKGGLIPGVTFWHRLNIENFQIVSIKRNVANAPYTKKIPPIIEPFEYKKLKNRKILIVDDIAGTGTTLLELTKILKKNGIFDFDILVLVKFNGDYSPPPTLLIKFFGKVCKNWVIFPWEKQPNLKSDT